MVQHADVLARYGSFRGKGEALWKSLYETSGDIVVWADTDVRNWHHRMVYGTLGPLLVEPRLQYVKGYYQRPIVEGGILKEGGGGRVTELVARPLHQPVLPRAVGDDPAAVRASTPGGARSWSRSRSSPGYAVEIGHLIDAAERAGLGGLGQVDLERRIHRNQELEGLSRMSFVILQAVMKRLEERRRARLFAELGSTMKLPRSGARPAVARGHRARRPRAPADDPHPGVPREAARGGRNGGRRRRRAGRLTPCAPGRPLRVLVAPDSFKGSLTSVEVARAIAAGWLRARPGDSVRLAPLADGGEGTLVAIEAAGGWAWREAEARGSARAADPGGVAGPGGRRRGVRRDGHGVRAVAGGAPASVTRPGPRAAGPATCCGPCWTPGSGTSRWASAGPPRPTAGPGCSGPWARRSPTTSRAVDLAGLDPRLARGAAADRLRRDEPAAGPGRGRRGLRPAEGRDARAGRGAGRAPRAVRRRAGGRDGPPRARHAGRRGRGRRWASASCAWPIGSRRSGWSRASTSSWRRPASTRRSRPPTS